MGDIPQIYMNLLAFISASSSLYWQILQGYVVLMKIGHTELAKILILNVDKALWLSQKEHEY
jgi:hypothetical protein